MKFNVRLLTLLVSGMFIFMAFGSEEEEEKRDIFDMKTEAFTISQNFVSASLKAPASADFPLLDFNSSYIGDSTFLVSSYVDAQNSFGAKIRTYFRVKLKYNGGDWADRGNWTLLEMKTE